MLPCLLLALLPVPSWAAEPVLHARWSVAEGLPVASVNDLAYDARGYLWAATFDGLVRFDGARFVVYSAESSPGLPSNRVVSLRDAPDGALVFTTESGDVGRFDPVTGRWNSARATEETPPVAVGPAGEIWAAHDDGVARLVGDRLLPFGPSLGARVTTLATEGSGTVWAGTVAGLARVRADEVRWWRPADGLPDGKVTAVNLDAGGTAWIATDAGPARLVAGVLEPLRVEGKPWVEASLYARPDGSGGAWVGTQEGLFHWRDGHAARVDPLDHERAPGGRSVTAGAAPWVATRRSLLLDGEVVYRNDDPVRMGIRSLLADRAGGVWVATSDDGLHHFSPAPIRTFGLAAGMSHPNAYSLATSRDGGVWIGTQRGGLNHLRGERVEVVFGADGPDRNVTAVLETRDGDLWIGTHDHGAFRRGPDGAWIPQGPRDATVRALTELADGTLLAGTNRGLWRRDGAGWAPWTLTGLPTSIVRAVEEGADGALWLGTSGEGVVRVVGDRVQRFGKAEGYPSDLVRALWVAPDGAVWVGTEDRGLYAIPDPANPSPSRPISTAAGPPDHCVHALVADEAGALWGSTNRGLFRVSLDGLGAWLRGSPDLVVDRFDERDGMSQREANGGVDRAGIRTPDGALWFATQAGVVRVDPDALRGAAPAPVLIEELEVDGIAASLPPGPLVLDPTRRTFGLTYTALAFHAPDRQRFWTRLVGLSDTWTSHGDRRTAWFTALAPGRYTFEVRATPPGTPGPVATLEVRVPPMWTETRLFDLALAALALGAVGLAWHVRARAARLRERELEALVAARTRELTTQTAAAEAARATIAVQADQLREMDRLKTRFFADLSHELRTPLTLVLGPLEDARTGRFGPLAPPLVEALARAERSTRRLRGLVDQLLDLVRVDVGALKLTLEPRDLVVMLGRLAEEFAPAAAQRGSTLDVALPSGVVAVACDARELEKVFANLLGNALKFTPAGGTVRLSLRVDAGRARVEVGDTGPGISLQDQARLFERFAVSRSSTMQAGTGIGLSLARELAERHGGQLTLSSELGVGSTFAVTLPVVEGPVVEDREARPRLDVEAPPPPAPADERDRTTVLVVDDAPELRAWIRSVLAPRYRVLEAADGAEGLHIAREQLPDLVVSDVMMPTLDGYDLVRGVRADRALDWLPVVLLTARGSEDAHVEGVARGADVYLTKPFSSAVLLAHVGQLLAQRERLRERFAAAPATPAPESLSADERYLRKVRAAIEARMGDPDFSVEDLADAVAQDRSNLFRQLKELTGEPPSTLIRTMRLERATELLKAEAGSISEIAYACGFASVSHFSRAFRAHFGVPPSGWSG